MPFDLIAARRIREDSIQRADLRVRDPRSNPATAAAHVGAELRPRTMGMHGSPPSPSQNRPAYLHVRMHYGNQATTHI
jgi:hypothetical protein